MTQLSPTCAERRLRSAVELLTPSQGSTPRATRSSKLNSCGSVFSSQKATWLEVRPWAELLQADWARECGYRDSEAVHRLSAAFPAEWPQTFSGVHDGGSLAGNDSCDSSVTWSPSAVWSRLPWAVSLSVLVGLSVPTVCAAAPWPVATVIRRAWAPCTFGSRSVSTPCSMRASALSELTGTGSVIERCIVPKRCSRISQLSPRRCSSPRTSARTLTRSPWTTTSTSSGLTPGTDARTSNESSCSMTSMGIASGRMLESSCPVPLMPCCSHRSIASLKLIISRKGSHRSSAMATAPLSPGGGAVHLHCTAGRPDLAPVKWPAAGGESEMYHEG